MAERITATAREALLRVLAAGETRSEAIAELLGVPVRTVRHRLGRLREARLVDAPTRGTWRLTGAGQRAALGTTVQEPAGVLDGLDALPAEHRALLRLVEDAVIARRALGDVYSSNWPAFVLPGPTKTGKTLLGTTAARRFGLDPAVVVRLLMLETAGSLLVRRVQSGAEAWHLVPSELLGLPLVVLDEFDKAKPEVQQAAFAYLAGTSHYRAEGGELDVRATTLITLNTERDPGTLLPDSYLRRAVVLDTAALRVVSADLDETARMLSRTTLPEVRPDLAPPAPELPEPARQLLRGLLRSCLTERGWELVDVEAIARLVLGRWATLPDDPEAAVRAVAADYLLVSATRPGFVASDWLLCFETLAGGPDAPIAAVLAIARERQAADESARAAGARADLDVALELAGTRERLRAALDHAVRSVARRDIDDAERATVATAQGKAGPLRQALAEARSVDALDELGLRVDREILVPLRTVADAVADRRQAALAARQREMDQRRQKAERARTQRAAAKARHAALQALYRRATTRPGESVLGTLVEARCLTERREEYQLETWGSMVEHSWLGRRLRGRGPAAQPAPRPDPRAAWLPLAVPPVTPEPRRRYETRVRAWYEDRAGHVYDVADLVAWGSEPVRAIIMAAAGAEGLPRLTLPRGTATRRRASAASRRPRVIRRGSRKG